MVAAHYIGGTRLKRIAVCLMGIVVMYAQALTGGGTGYATWGLLGLLLGVLYWRKLLVLVLVGAVAVTLLVPSAKERMLQGFTNDGSRDRNAQVEAAQGVSVGYEEGGVDSYAVTAGRSVIGRYVIEKIGDNPIVGYGRLAMKRTGLSRRLAMELGESFPHPHNAYLEWLLDNGVVGFLIVIPFYLLLLIRGISPFRDPRSLVFTVAGGMTVSLVVALLIASFGSQTFYLREGWVGLWCVFGLMMRVWVNDAGWRCPSKLGLERSLTEPPVRAGWRDQPQCPRDPVRLRHATPPCWAGRLAAAKRTRFGAARGPFAPAGSAKHPPTPDRLPTPSIRYFGARTHDLSGDSASGNWTDPAALYRGGEPLRQHVARHAARVASRHLHRRRAEAGLD